MISYYFFPLLGQRVLAFMLTGIVDEIDTIYDLSGFVATLDNLISLATVRSHQTTILPKIEFDSSTPLYTTPLQISARNDYVCPTFTDEMRIVDAFHPLLEGNVRNTAVVPNNIVSDFPFSFSISFT